MNEDSRSAMLRTAFGTLRAIVCLVLLSLPATAGSPWEKLFGCGVPDCIGRWCPDDYCEKKAPCTNVPLCFRCDDYCSKKAPCVCAPLCFVCDDYCKKCPPQICSSPLRHVAKCGSPDQACDGATCDALCHQGIAARTLDALKPVDIVERLTVEDDTSLVNDPSPAAARANPPVVIATTEIRLTK